MDTDITEVRGRSENILLTPKCNSKNGFLSQPIGSTGFQGGYGGMSRCAGREMILQGTNGLLTFFLKRGGAIGLALGRKGWSGEEGTSPLLGIPRHQWDDVRQHKEAPPHNALHALLPLRTLLEDHLPPYLQIALPLHANGLPPPLDPKRKNGKNRVLPQNGNHIVPGQILLLRGIKH